jgi:hypothetical protein
MEGTQVRMLLVFSGAKLILLCEEMQLPFQDIAEKKFPEFFPRNPWDLG